MSTEDKKTTETMNPEQNDRAKQKQKTKPVVVYLSLLIIVVIGLLLLSYFMQHRNNEELETLSQTVSSMQDTYDAMNTINDMQATISDQMAEIDELEEQLEDYEDRIEELEEQLEETEQTAEDAAREIEALKALRTLEQTYAQGDYEACTEIIETLSDLSDALPDEEAARYEELKLLVEAGMEESEQEEESEN